jgi:hypothetical protein
MTARLSHPDANPVPGMLGAALKPACRSHRRAIEHAWQAHSSQPASSIIGALPVLPMGAESQHGHGRSGFLSRAIPAHSPRAWSHVVPARELREPSSRAVPARSPRHWYSARFPRAAGHTGISRVPVRARFPGGSRASASFLFRCNFPEGRRRGP